MIKRESIYILVVLLLTLTSCENTNWSESFQERSTDPFGTYILANELENLFDNNETRVLDEHIYDYLLDDASMSVENHANYVCVKSYAYRLDDLSTAKILEYVALGNDAFLALSYFNETLQKELNFEVSNEDGNTYNIQALKELDGNLYLKGKSKSYYYDRNLKNNYFETIDTTTTVVLGTQKAKGVTNPNFIKIKHGLGYVFLHTQPIAFTNYYLLKDENAAYVEQVFSYLPDRDIILDTQRHRSTYNQNKGDRPKTSALNFFYSNPSLKWSLYVAFFGLLLFLFLNARRKQRAIPELKPLKNSTQDFTHTIANLYLKEENHKNLVTKKITYFLEKVRSLYHIDTQNLNDSFVEKLAAKSGNTEHTTKYLINTIITVNKRSQCSQDELIRLNTLIENFFKNK